MKVSSILAITLPLISLSLPACNMHKEQDPHKEQQQIVATSPMAKNVVVTQPFVCQIHSQKHIEIKPLKTDGYLEEIPIKEGQLVKEGDVLFQLLPTLYKARLDAEAADVEIAEIKLKNSKILNEQTPPVVSAVDVALNAAELAKARAKKDLAQREYNLTTIKAPFDGIVDRLLKQKGSLIKEGEPLTTLSDNSVMWVYFNVPEARYLEYMGSRGKGTHNSQKLELIDSRIDLVLADGSTFNHSPGNTVTIEGQVNNETGNIAFRADFPNPDRLLRHGQTGNLLIHRTLHDAIVIPQRATFEILDKRYVYVIDKDDVVHQRQIVVLHEMDDIFVVAKSEHREEEHKKGEEHKKEGPIRGIDVTDRIVLEGVRQVHEREKIEFEFRKPEDVLANQKEHAE